MTHERHRGNAHALAHGGKQPTIHSHKTDTQHRTANHLRKHNHTTLMTPMHQPIQTETQRTKDNKWMTHTVYTRAIPMTRTRRTDTVLALRPATRAKLAKYLDQTQRTKHLYGRTAYAKR